VVRLWQKPGGDDRSQDGYLPFLAVAPAHPAAPGTGRCGRPEPAGGCAAGGLALVVGVAGQPEKDGQGDDNQGEPTPHLKDLQAV
jgi:hypothetical protein